MPAEIQIPERDAAQRLIALIRGAPKGAILCCPTPAIKHLAVIATAPDQLNRPDLVIVLQHEE